MTVLVTGSVAFDRIVRVAGRFSDRLEDAAAAGFSAAYVAPKLLRRFGGCAGNIAYGLQQLGEAPLLMATAGEDFAPYLTHLKEHGIDASHIKTIDNEWTAQAFMISDAGESQIIVFHPGATDYAHHQTTENLDVNLAIIGPNGKEGMMKFARELAQRNTPFIFDPGQAVGLFSAEELREAAALCRVAIFNQDEYAAFEKMTGESLAAQNNQTLIITHGEEGSEGFHNGERFEIAVAKFGATADTTGCGDAYRAGILYGMQRQWQWRKILSFASVVAGIKATCDGGQEYAISAQQAQQECQKRYGL